MQQLARPLVRPLVSPLAIAGAGGRIDPVILAYQEATGISAASAGKLNDLWSALKAASAGTEPVFLWVGGSDYNSASNLKTVVGGDLTLVGTNAPAPTVNAKSLRITPSTKFLRGANATAADSKWTWAAWYNPLNETSTQNALLMRNSGTTERGPLFQANPATPTTTLTTSAAGTGQNANVAPVTAGPKCLLGPTFLSATYDPANAPVELRVYFTSTYEIRNMTVYNAHAYVRIGGFDDIYGSGTPWLLSNADFYAVVAYDVDLSEAQMAALRIALYDSGVQAKHATIPAMVYLGDSTTATRWNLQMHGSTAGGAWRNRVALGAPIDTNPGDMGGKGFDYHYQKKDLVIQTLNSLPYEDRYFFYCADQPSGMPLPSSWVVIGVEEGDVDGYYAVMEQWLLDIQAATGCEIVLASYIQGTTAGAGEADRDRVAALASDNGFTFVDFWNEPHSKVPTTLAGFYTDIIHQSTAGSIVQAEYITSILPHPNMPSAPRFNVAAPPAITGTQQNGQTLSCSTGTPHVAGTAYTYQWLRNLATISGATSSTYTLQAADVGNYISCRVTATKSGQPSASFTAAPTGAIT